MSSRSNGVGRFVREGSFVSSESLRSSSRLSASRKRKTRSWAPPRSARAVHRGVRERLTEPVDDQRAETARRAGHEHHLDVLVVRALALAPASGAHRARRRHRHRRGNTRQRGGEQHGEGRVGAHLVRAAADSNRGWSVTKPSAPRGTADALERPRRASSSQHSALEGAAVALTRASEEVSTQTLSPNHVSRSPLGLYSLRGPTPSGALAVAARWRGRPRTRPADAPADARAPAADPGETEAPAPSSERERARCVVVRRSSSNRRFASPHRARVPRRARQYRQRAARVDEFREATRARLAETRGATTSTTRWWRRTSSCAKRRRCWIRCSQGGGGRGRVAGPSPESFTDETPPSTTTRALRAGGGRRRAREGVGVLENPQRAPTTCVETARTWRRRRRRRRMNDAKSARASIELFAEHATL